MLERVTAATDGSDCGNRAVEVGIALAERVGAAVDVLYVRTAAADAGSGDRTDAERRVLDGAVAPAEGTGVAVETHVLEGRPAERLVGFAAGRGSDLLVLGRRGRSGLAAHLLGSVTERVLRTAEVPVLTVPSGDAAPAFGAVLLTTDGSEAAATAVPLAADVARRCGATLHVLSAVDVRGEAGVVDAGGVTGEFVERLAARAREAVEGAAGAVEGCEVETAVVRGSPHEVVGRYIEENDVDLVVLASKGQTNLAGQHLGSVAGRVLRTADVPVLVVPVRS